MRGVAPERMDARPHLDARVELLLLFVILRDGLQRPPTLEGSFSAVSKPIFEEESFGFHILASGRPKIYPNFETMKKQRTLGYRQ